MGLRARLLGLVAAVVLATLLSVALYSSLAARRAFVEVNTESEVVLDTASQRVDTADLAALLASSPPERWPMQIDSAAKALSEPHWLLAFDAGGALRAASDPALGSARIELDERGVMSLEQPSIAGEYGRVESLILQAPTIRFGTQDAASAGYLAVLPRPGNAAAQSITRRQRFDAALDRSLLLGVAAVGLLALLVTHWLTGRVLAPVHALTRGARRMAQGDFSARVEVARRDELGELGLAFNDMAEGLGAIEVWRQSMLNDTAHELRTPLSNLQCRIEAMQDGLLPCDRQQLDTVHGELRRLARLIDDLRDLALAEAGRLVLHVEPIELGAVLQAALETLGADAARIRVERAGDDRIEADPGRLRQVFENLLRNACLHGGGADGVEVSCCARPDGLQVDIADRGPGLDVSVMPRLFDRFYRAGDARPGGSGLGLAIVRQIVLAHGGEIEAGNRPDGGARFSLHLPRKPPTAARPMSDGGAKGPAGQRPETLD